MELTLNLKPYRLLLVILCVCVVCVTLCVSLRLNPKTQILIDVELIALVGEYGLIMPPSVTYMNDRRTKESHILKLSGPIGLGTEIT